MKKRELIIKNEIEELAKIEPFTEEFASGTGILQETLFKLNLIMDEILCNIISYGYNDSMEHTIKVIMVFDGHEINIEVIDDGIVFNPIEKTEPDLERPIEERPVGGLGIYIIKNTVDGMSYKRLDNKNILTMNIKCSGQE